MKAKTSLPILGIAIAWLAMQLPAGATNDPLDHWQTVPTTGMTPSWSIRYVQGTWLGLTAGFLLSSSNGVNWEIAKVAGVDSWQQELHHADGLWVLAGWQSGTNPFVETSRDGKTWTNANLPPLPPYESGGPGSSGGWMLGYGGGEWILRVRQELVLRSIDGLSWTPSPLLAPPGVSIWGLTYGDGKWVAQGNPFRGNQLIASTNFVDWTAWGSLPADAKGHFYNLDHFNGMWIGMTGPSLHECCPMLWSIHTSKDRTNWVTHHSSLELSWLGLVKDRLLATSCDVTRYPMQISDPLLSLQKQGQGEVTVRRAAGMPVVVQWTDDLQTWHTLTNLAAGLPLEKVTDTVTNAPMRFYRAHTP